MFVKTTVRKRGDKAYTYLSLVESVRVDGKMTHNTLLRLGEVGELRRTKQLDRIIAALNRPGFDGGSSVSIAHATEAWASAA